jgi:hypothetical protein
MIRKGYTTATVLPLIKDLGTARNVHSNRTKEQYGGNMEGYWDYLGLFLASKVGSAFLWFRYRTVLREKTRKYFGQKRQRAATSIEPV